MPVVNFSLKRLEKLFPRLSIEMLLERIPFVGLDIEGIDNNYLRLEYNPNRPDFSSDYGIARALKGLFEEEVGIPKFELQHDLQLNIKIDKSVLEVRPFIGGIVARNGILEDETIRQLISMQEDLHMGLGRRRKKASIGIHDFDKIKFPLTYTTAADKLRISPLDSSEEMTVAEILKETEQGRKYSHIIEGKNIYPVIADNDGKILSLPPIINSNITAISNSTTNLFIEVTANDRQSIFEILAIMAMALFDAGFTIFDVYLDNNNAQDRAGSHDTSSLHIDTKLIEIDIADINSILGLNLDANEIIRCLEKCRLGADLRKNTIRCSVPFFRSDLFGSIDVVEEVAIGYGIDKLVPFLPSSSEFGQQSAQSNQFNDVRQTMTGLGMIETLNSSLIGRELYSKLNANTDIATIRVEDTKSSEHEILRNSLVPSILENLSRNIHEEYPQKLFELGKVFTSGKAIEESWNLAALIASSSSDFTMAKSILQSFMMTCFGIEIETISILSPYFMEGRSAEIIVKGRKIGAIGEISPIYLHEMHLRTPVCAFEINISLLLNLS